MIKRLRKGLLLCLLMGSYPAWASCWEEVAGRYDIEPELLKAIAVVESGARAGAMNPGNSDGSRDIGLMQINSMHLPRLAKQGITEERLLTEPCLSIEVGASILADFIQRFGYNWTAVGSYNAGPAPEREALRLRYAEKIWAQYEALVAHRQ
ncbi:invasion protein IagB [Pseudomonas edaphica]|jgi:soluble lytic murein transglycosylase-like protein|uniref:Invasion protein IagB n=1 Tax=Pseudomonas edaphica TaxID=2006980 RepID=A0A5R8QSY4_9PSED|nr:MULTISPECIES: transglycosylase SLT domain-containing protein [Pseudomonas]MCF5144515.1 transglycosylase SLT domain-containing protein [Pseudomonas sp. PA-6-3C]MCF5145855.1 transglycosylase SLT domain-containing protein [Pseudomonas sp. PA-6-3F]MCF5158081.1 transglycosylase SLT domain-containing protein [Pseudomonas sp. PA-6-2E]MCF5176715.1 transglycosylase SLT domain-containing protein [Pseudomonas sp. PA-6-1D]MCF5191388.1 transglycosylase SLT domain-containing protein [Pseudomonas sp. PA-6